MKTSFKSDPTIFVTEDGEIIDNDLLKDYQYIVLFKKINYRKNHENNECRVIRTYTIKIVGKIPRQTRFDFD